MAPYKGSIHRRARSDSGAARLWHWARTRRRPWTVDMAAAAAEISDRRGRAIVRALYEADLLDCLQERELTDQGWAPAEWTVSEYGRAVTSAPIMIAEEGIITGLRIAADDGVGQLRQAVERSGLSVRAAARQLGVNDRTLRRMLSGETPLTSDDPILQRARELR